MAATLRSSNGRRQESSKERPFSPPKPAPRARRNADALRTIDLSMLRAVLSVRSPLQFWFRAVLVFSAILAYPVLGNEALQRSAHFKAALLTVAALIGMALIGFLVDSILARQGAGSTRRTPDGQRPTGGN